MAGKKLNGNVVCVVQPSDIALDADLKKTAEDSRDQMIAGMKTFAISDAIRSVWSFIQRCNRYVEETAPWNLAKESAGERRFAEVMFNLVESLRWIGVMIFPFVPETSQKLFDQIGLGRDYAGKARLQDLSWSKACKEFQVSKKEPLFPRLERPSA
jgi:methionyl-tRNA synthetase